MKVLLFSIPGFHLGSLGCYGNEWIGTPTLDFLAAHGVVFDQHLATTIDPLQSRFSRLSGRFAFPLNAVELPLALANLRQAGIHTALIHRSDRPLVSGEEQCWTAKQAIPWPLSAMDERESLLQATTSTLRQLHSAPNWLLEIELAGLLPPWQVPEDMAEVYDEPEGETDEEATEPLALLDEQFLKTQNRFAAAVTYLDATLGAILELIEGVEPLANLLIIVTSDYGQSLGERGERESSPRALHEEWIHLPLLFVLPEGAQEGRRVRALTQPIDLLPTLGEAFGMANSSVQGQSLWPLLEGKIAAIRPYACAGLAKGSAWAWTLRTPDWALVIPFSNTDTDDSARPQLFVKPEDRWEINDVRQHHLEWSEQLEKTLQAFVTASQQPGPLQTPPLPDRVTGEPDGLADPDSGKEEAS